VPPLCMLIKPASGNCDLRCEYCFYRDITESRHIGSYGIMEEELLEELIRKAFSFAEGSCTFAFQGGEPTLAGLDFLRKFIAAAQAMNSKGLSISYSIQTNAQNIDDEWAGFLAANKFLTGISLDGPKNIHDALRTDAAGAGSFKRVIDSIEAMDRHGAQYNILSVVTAYSARHAAAIYGFFKKKGFKYLQFIPCLEPLSGDKGPYPYSLTAQKYACFLKNLFDCWYKDIISGEMVSIRFFDNIVRMASGLAPEECGMSGRCSCQFVIEADGGIYPCDFYVTDEWRLGSIKDNELSEIIRSPKLREFIAVSEDLPGECAACKWFALCRGGCRRYRENSLNRFCTAYKDFFVYTAERIYRLANRFFSSDRPLSS